MQNRGGKRRWSGQDADRAGRQGRRAAGDASSTRSAPQEIQDRDCDQGPVLPPERTELELPVGGFVVVVDAGLSVSVVWGDCTFRGCSVIDFVAVLPPGPIAVSRNLWLLEQLNGRLSSPLGP